MFEWLLERQIEHSLEEFAPLLTILKVLHSLVALKSPLHLVEWERFPVWLFLVVFAFLCWPRLLAHLLSEIVLA